MRFDSAVVQMEMLSMLSPPNANKLKENPAENLVESNVVASPGVHYLIGGSCFQLESVQFESMSWN